MALFKNFGFTQLARRTLAVIAASTGLSHSESNAVPQDNNHEVGVGNPSYGWFQKKILNQKLVLKLNPNNADKSLLAYHSSHRSHSSHSSHRSHASHYSGSSAGYTRENSSGGGGKGLLFIALSAAAAYAAYQYGKSKREKK